MCCKGLFNAWSNVQGARIIRKGEIFVQYSGTCITYKEAHRIKTDTPHLAWWMCMLLSHFMVLNGCPVDIQQMASTDSMVRNPSHSTLLAAFQ